MYTRVCPAYIVHNVGLILTVMVLVEESVIRDADSSSIPEGIENVEAYVLRDVFTLRVVSSTVTLPD